QETVAPDRKLLALAAAAHDAQRQDEGIDHWDGASGRAFYSYLASKDYPKETCELYAHALIEKDPTEKDAAGRPIFISDVQRLVHDADVLEIMRVLRNRNDFQSERLAALAVWEESKQQALTKIPAEDGAALAEAQGRISEIETDLQQIVLEWGDFIEMTEKPEFKMLLEYTPSIDYYTEVLKILKYVTGKGALPTLKKFLAEELAQVTARL
ncbi:MAG: hypothetical protein NTX49_09715, partial [Chlamydiae bacterium]|nr:hypothetical protein [Chlamydiota bacterium]